MDPSISVKRKVTVPVGRFFKSGLLGTSGAGSHQTTPSAVTVFPPRTQRERTSVDLAEELPCFDDNRISWDYLDKGMKRPA